MKGIYLTGVELPRHRKSKSDSKKAIEAQPTKQLTLPPVSTVDHSIQHSLHELNTESFPYNNSRHLNLHDSMRKVNQLEGRSRLIENHYKKNLKQAFEQKIKTYRLQSYMQRKDEQFEMMNQLHRREQDLLEQKTQKIQTIKLGKVIGKQVASNRLSERNQRAKLQSRAAKQQGQQARKTRLSELYNNNLKAREQIRSSHLQQRQRRDLLLKLAEMHKRQLHAIQIKKQLQEIIQRQQKLSVLKDQLMSLHHQAQQN